MSEGLDRFLVCGLGSLGQHCVLALKEFGAIAIAIDRDPPQNWEIPNLPDLLADFMVGDCRQNQVLEAAQIKRCRAVLLVTNSEQVNTETALAVRQLNPHARLVVRSAKENLNQLLSQQLGNFIAFDPAQLSTSALAMAAFGTETLGLFDLDGQKLRIIKHQIDGVNSIPSKAASLPETHWLNTRRLHELDTRTRRIIAHTPQFARFSPNLHQWEPEAIVSAGDTLVYIEAIDSFSLQSVGASLCGSTHHPLVTSNRRSRQHRGVKALYRRFENLKRQLAEFWQLSWQQQIRRVALLSSFVVLALLFAGTVLLQWYYPQSTWISAFYATAWLLLGGYGDLFGNFPSNATIPWWLQLFSLGLTVSGTIFVGVLYALLTEALLSAKFQFVKQRPPVPSQNHVAIIGLGRVGQQVAASLQELRQPLVGITLNPDLDPTIFPQMPLITGNLTEALAKANLATAKSVAVVTDDEILNLEIALMARSLNPTSHLVIRTSGIRLEEHLTELLPTAQVLGVDAVAAEAFAGAAFGENIINLFRLNNQTILVTEYQIESGDTLNGLLLAELAYGYDVVPILHAQTGNPPTFMPSDDIRLARGDRLVVLATIEGLQRIEPGKPNLADRTWQVRVETARTPDAAFEGANAIARIAGCSLKMARDFMNQLPQTLPVFLYKHQAQRLVRELNKLLVKASSICGSSE
jgi:Trk K+ transport system NAD-binding subunit